MANQPACMKPLVVSLILITLSLIGCQPSQTNTAPWFTPREAIEAAAEAAPEKVAGKFVATIQASGRDGNMFYLNTEKDYRDQRNLSFAVSPGAQQELVTRYGPIFEDILIGHELTISGYAERVTIWILDGHGQRTDLYYYQTHVNVFTLSQIEGLP